MRHHHRTTAAPNYTAAALIMAGVNLTWVFFVIWAAWGLVPVMILGSLINHLISRLAQRRSS